MIFSNPRDKLFQAIKKRANCFSEIEFNRVMRDFYADQAKNIDPHTDWWQFAEMKHKEQEYARDMAVWVRRYEQAEKLVQALHARYVRGG